MAAWSSGKHLGVLRVLGSEGLGELTLVQTAISVLIMSLDEEAGLFCRYMHTNISKAVLDVKSSYRAQVSRIENTPRVRGIEVVS